MRKSKAHEYRQAYNAQAVVDAGGSQLIVGARISQCASDRNDLTADIEAIPAALGPPKTALADNGYANGDEVESLAEIGIEVLVATGAEAGEGAVTVPSARYFAPSARKARCRAGNSAPCWPECAPESQNPRTLVSFQSPTRKTPAKPLSTTS